MLTYCYCCSRLTLCKATSFEVALADANISFMTLGPLASHQASRSFLDEYTLSARKLGLKMEKMGDCGELR